MSIDGMSLSVLVRELSSQLVGGRIDKIYQVGKSTLVIWIRQMRQDFCLIISTDAENPGVYIADQAPDNPSVPPAFCMLLRKHFEEGHISRIYQHSLDRIICLEIDVREEYGVITTKSLIVELMGKHSNLIFTQNGLIVDAIKRIGRNVNRFRQILPGLEYQLPPGQYRVNFLEVSTDEYLTVLRNQNSGPLLKAIINTAAGIGTVTASEIIRRAGLPTDIEIMSLDGDDFFSIGEAIDSIRTDLQTDVVEPNIVFNKASIKAATAIKLEYLDKPEYDRKVFQNMNELVVYTSKRQKNKIIPDFVILTKLVESVVTRLNRKRQALSDELTEAENADQVRKYGDLLMANLYNIKKQATKIQVQDFYNESVENVTIDLDPLITPIENVQAYYNKYAKLKRGYEILVDQLNQCIDEINYLEGILVSLNNATSYIEFDEIRQELIVQGYLKESNKKRMKTIEKSEPHKVITPDGIVILVGKNNRQNDYVTFKLAGPDDIWFHTKNIPGSHVVLRSGKQQVSESDLLDAAQLAAYFSKARNSSSVPVDYTRRRFVKKPTGSKPGFVIYTNQNTISVTPDETLIKKMLDNEE